MKEEEEEKVSREKGGEREKRQKIGARKKSWESRRVAGSSSSEEGSLHSGTQINKQTNTSNKQKNNGTAERLRDGI